MAAPKKPTTHVTFTPSSGGSVTLPKATLCVLKDPITDIYRVFLADSKEFWRVSEETASSIIEELNP